MRTVIPRRCYERENAALANGEVDTRKMTAEEYEYHFGAARPHRDFDGKLINVGVGTRMKKSEHEYRQKRSK